MNIPDADQMREIIKKNIESEILLRKDYVNIKFINRLEKNERYYEKIREKIIIELEVLPMTKIKKNYIKVHSPFCNIAYADNFCKRFNDERNTDIVLSWGKEGKEAKWIFTWE